MCVKIDNNLPAVRLSLSLPLHYQCLLIAAMESVFHNKIVFSPIQNVTQTIGTNLYINIFVVSNNHILIKQNRKK